MDHKRANPVKRMSAKAYIAIAVIAFLAAAYVLSTLDFSSRRIDRDNLLIDIVEFGDLDIKVGANGILLAKEVEYLATQVEGRVTRLKVRPGDSVAEGQVLVELTNPDLITAFDQAGSALEGAKASLVSFQVDIENRLLNQQSTTLRAKFDLEKARLQLEADRQLIEKNIISQIEYQQSQLDVEQLAEMYAIEQSRLSKSESNMVSQIAVEESKVKQAIQALTRAEDQMNALLITAQMAGIVQELNLNIGQRIQPGTSVGRIARQDVLYAELNVPSRQASDVVMGQRVEIDTRNGVIEGIVSRIDPAVIDGTVLIDVDLISKIPKAARPELAVEGTIYVAEIKNSLYTGKPAFTRINSEQSIYRLDAEGNYAERIVIKVGQASVNYIEILSGLEAGDRVILSDSSDWQDYSRILLN